MNQPSTPVWSPDPALSSQTQMAAFIKRVAVDFPEVTDFASLYAWSLAAPAAFWAAVAEFTGLSFRTPGREVYSQPGDLRTARWFEGATLNFAENLIESGYDDVAVLIFRDESERRHALTRAELRQQVADVAAGMRRFGLRPGDRIAAVLPNCPETVIVMLAAASLGVVFSSCSPDFGAEAILDRFSQIQPRLLFVCDGYHYGGRLIELAEKNAALSVGLETLEVIVQIDFVHTGREPAGMSLHEFAIAGSEAFYPELPFDQPLYILYSSGTTGRPKCIMHGAGGTLLQHQKELRLHTNLGVADTLFYFTTCGWMMWNWLVSALATGARVVLYDGSPFHPAPTALLEMAAEEGVTVFGTSPRYLAALENAAVTRAPVGAAIRTVLSTGAPLPAASYDYVHGLLGADVQLCSISGGTDLISCFALGNPLLPVYRGELQCRGLGMAVDVFDADGNSLSGSGELGELVCTQAFPSMPLGFWNDPDGARYAAAYFERYPGVWTHGDLARVTERGGLIIEGRSDAVLNPGGVRMGSAEVCGPALRLAEVDDAVAIGHAGSADQQCDEQIVLFVVPTAGTELDDELRARICAEIRTLASPRHVPQKILAVPDIPRTMSGKVVELAIRAVMEGRPVDNLGAIANPQALEHFRDRL